MRANSRALLRIRLLDSVLLCRMPFLKTVILVVLTHLPSPSRPVLQNFALDLFS